MKQYIATRIQVRPIIWCGINVCALLLSIGLEVLTTGCSSSTITIGSQEFMKPVWVIRGTGFDRTIALRLDSIHTGSLFVKVDDGERKILIDSIHKIVHVPEGQGGLYVGGGAMIGGLAGMIYGGANRSNDSWGESLKPSGYMMAGILSGAAVGSLIEIHLTAPRAYNMMHDSYEQKVSVLSAWIR